MYIWVSYDEIKYRFYIGTTNVILFNKKYQLSGWHEVNCQVKIIVFQIFIKSGSTSSLEKIRKSLVIHIVSQKSEVTWLILQ